jgi:hypothetical protein
MVASCGGGSPRMWESHACHSAGTCEALYSCYEKKICSALARVPLMDVVTNLRKVDPTMTACKLVSGIAVEERQDTERSTRHFLFRVEILEITVSEPIRTAKVNVQSKCTCCPSRKWGRTCQSPQMCQPSHHLYIATDATIP